MELREFVGMERMIEWLPRSGQPLVTRFAAATGVMVIAFLIGFGFARFLELPGLAILLFGVFLCAVLFDHGTGFYAGVLAIVSETYTLQLSGLRGPSFVGAVTFAMVCGAVALFGEALRKAMERAVAAERTSSILLRELQHRTQNTLSIIVALLELQARSSASNEAKQALKAAAERVRIQSEAQRHLTLKHEGKVDAGEYLREICQLLDRSLRGARALSINCEVQHTLVEPQKALALGLVTNELVTNCVKYAFGDHDTGTITVRLDRNEQGNVRLTVQDDGRGCPDAAPTGMGTRLISALVEEYKGSYSRANRSNGCEAVVTLAPKRGRG